MKKIEYPNIPILTVLLFLILAGSVVNSITDTDLDRKPQTPASPLKASTNSGSMKVSEKSQILLPEELSDYINTPVVRESTFEIEIQPPTDATEMQVGFDPTFTQTPWQKLDNSAKLTSRHVGYQTIFARFRESDQSTPSSTVIADVIIDSNYLNEGNEPISISPLSNRILLVRFIPGKMIWAEDKNIIYNKTDLDLDLLKTPWNIQTEGTNITSSEVRLLSRGNGSGFDGQDPITATQHDFVLIFDTPLKPNTEYKVIAPDKSIEPATYEYKENSTASPMVQTNQAGWAPNDSKYAYVGGWYEQLPNLSFDETTEFKLINTIDKTVVYKSNLNKQPKDSIGKGDLTGSDVFAADFSKYKEPGRYTICVMSLGCSLEFDIADDVWLDLTSKVARATYHQRSAISLGPPYTSVQRPRPRHPDDGNLVTKTDFSLLEAEKGNYSNAFEKIVSNDTEEIAENAWGGHHDAGDWDRRIKHLWYARSALDLAVSYPELYSDLTFNIPESENNIPDILDEGIWTIDLFMRMQAADGAVSGGVEASEHPDKGAASWTSELRLFQFKPDPWSSYIYAGVVAEYSVELEKYDTELAVNYKNSALAAMNWAESQPTPLNDREAEAIKSQRQVAAASMILLTGDQQWIDLFEELSPFNNKAVDILNCNERRLCDAAWIYTKLPEEVQDQKTIQNIKNSFIKNANGIVEIIDNTSYSFSLESKYVPLRWGTGLGGAPKTLGLLRAYELTNGNEYLKAAQKSSGVSLGANPTNTVYLTGVGQTPVKYPLIVDSVNKGLPVWPGTPVYGNHDINQDENWIYEYRLKPAGVGTDPMQLPYLWKWQDVYYPQFNEFTIHQSHAQALHSFGSLAGIVDADSNAKLK